MSLETHAFNAYNKNEVNLPLYTLLTDDEVEYVAKAYKKT